jgi:hypothetical protein
VTYIHNEGEGKEKAGETQHPIGWLFANITFCNSTSWMLLNILLHFYECEDIIVHTPLNLQPF